MAIVKPLCNYGNGEIKELQAGDTLPGAGGGGGGSSPIVTIFSASGTYSNPQTGIIRVILIGAGTGGGAGRRGAAGTNRFGGGSASSAAYSIGTFVAADLPASIPVWVGAGGIGASAVSSDNTNGVGGGQGGSTIFGGNSSSSDINIYMTANASGFSSGGGSSASSGSQSTINWIEGLIQINTAAGIAPSNTNPAAVGISTRSQQVGTAGGMGGGIDTANTVYMGGQSDRPVGTNFGNPSYIPSSSGGATTGAAGANGTFLYGRRAMYLLSTGGGGGAAGDAAGTIAGGRGGNGSIGSSGGGGGASTNGANSGGGGNGGNGLAVIIHWV